jgi:hypothetical protein
MKRFCNYLLLLMILTSLTTAGTGQKSESFLDQFQRNLMDSFIGNMRAGGKEVTPRHRAMFMGYILNRQAARIGAYDMDKRRMDHLIAEVKGFLKDASPGRDLWPVVEAGMRGEYNQEVDAMLGGSAYVTAIFPTLDEMVGSWNKWDYNSNRFYSHPDNEAILSKAQTFLRMMKAKQYQDGLKLTTGRCFEQFSEWLSETASSRERNDRFSQYLENLEWKAGLAGMTDTDPPMVKIIFALRDPDGDWDDDPCIMILDDGIWKIARFLD